MAAKLPTMVVMVTCKNCGHEYKSEVLQTPMKRFSDLSPEDIMENCPKCNQISSYNGPDSYWKQHHVFSVDIHKILGKGESGITH